MYFLASRHGVKADLDFVKERLMPSLAGALGETKTTNIDNNKSVFDIVEMTSLLLIPHLLQLVNDPNRRAERNVFFGRVRDLILADVTGSNEAADAPPLQSLNRAFVRQLLEFYGEERVSQRAIDDMLAAAGVRDDFGEVLFSAEALAKATTGDVWRYRATQWDESLTTHFDDVFHGSVLDVVTTSTTTTNASSRTNTRHDYSEKDEDMTNTAVEETEQGMDMRPALDRVASVRQAVEERKVVVRFAFF